MIWGVMIRVLFKRTLDRGMVKLVYSSLFLKVVYYNPQGLTSVYVATAKVLSATMITEIKLKVANQTK